MTSTLSSSTDTNKRPATVVPDDRRDKFLSDLFGLLHLIICENTVFHFMEKLSPQDYGGGFWNFYERDGKPLYLAPVSDTPFRVAWDGNGYSGTVSADAAGIIATLFTLSHLSFQFESDRFAHAYARLHAYASEHPEAAEIFQAID